MANTNRINGIIDRVSNAENIEDINWILGEPVINLSESVVDRYVETNAKFQTKAGIQSTVKREMHGETCEWCRQRAGSFVINEEDLPDGFWARHENCDCTITYRGDKMKRSGNAFIDKNKRSHKQTKEKETKLLEYDESIAKLKKIQCIPDNSLLKMNQKLLSDNAKRLESLETQYHVLEKSSSTNISYLNKTSETIASEQAYFSSKGGFKLEFFFESKEYSDFNTFYERIINEVSTNWAMPCTNKYLTVYDITHEYGHAVEDSVISERLTSIKNIRSVYAEEKRIFNELIDIVEKEFPDASPKDYYSDYIWDVFNSDKEPIHRFHEEVFAEGFASANCGKPNILGKAMNIWLRRNGF